MKPTMFFRDINIPGRPRAGGLIEEQGRSETSEATNTE
jgi:hypothetical protein